MSDRRIRLSERIYRDLLHRLARLEVAIEDMQLSDRRRRLLKKLLQLAYDCLLAFAFAEVAEYIRRILEEILRK